MTVPFGGWTPTYEGDMCGGGHPGGWYEERGFRFCNRCGRVLDPTPCRCGNHVNDTQTRSFCPVAQRHDKRALIMNNHHRMAPATL